MLHFTSLAVLPACAEVLPARAASFDCSKASTPDERAICAEPDLSNADEKLADLYAKLHQLLGGKERQDLVATQREWQQARAKCGEDTICLASEYDRRTKSLQELLGKPQIAALALFRRTGQCSHCNLSGADLSGIQPATHADNGQLACTISAVANGVFDGVHASTTQISSAATRKTTPRSAP